MTDVSEEHQRPTTFSCSTGPTWAGSVGASRTSTAAPPTTSWSPLIEREADELGLKAVVRQSDSEAELMNWIHRAADAGDPVILNAGALTHTSVALRDACAELRAPLIEVHISNVHAREEFRHHSYLSAVATGVIVGLGVQGYLLALRYLAGPAASRPSRSRRVSSSLADRGEHVGVGALVVVAARGVALALVALRSTRQRPSATPTIAADEHQQRGERREGRDLVEEPLDVQALVEQRDEPATAPLTHAGEQAGQQPRHRQVAAAVGIRVGARVGAAVDETPDEHHDGEQDDQRRC